MKKKTETKYRSRAPWLDWQALATGFLVFWAVILVGVSVLWWSGGMATMRLIVIKQLKENAIELVIPEGWRY